MNGSSANYRDNTRVVAGTDTVELVYLPGDSDTVLVTFNGLEFWADGRSLSAGEVAQKLGMPALGFMSRNANWFPAADMAQLAPIARELLRPHPIRFHYGFSMGGYGAIKYSRLLDATHVLALGPQWSIDPEVAPWEQLYVHLLRPCHKSMEIKRDDGNGRIYVIYDHHDKDRLHAERIHAAVGCDLIQACFAGHDAVWRLFLSSDAMREAIDAVTRGDSVGLRRLVRARLRLIPDIESRTYFTRARQLMDKNRFSEAERLARLALQARAPTPGVGFLLCRLLVMQGRAEEAEAVIRAEMVRSPNVKWLGLYLCEALEAQGRDAEALEVITPVYQDMPSLHGAPEAIERLNRRLGQTNP